VIALGPVALDRVTRSAHEPAYHLAELLSRLTREATHESLSEGDPVGREVW